MQSIDVIRTAALEALDDSEDDAPEALTAFRQLVDPRTVLELLELAENSVNSEKMKALAALIRDMEAYIEKVPDVDGTGQPLKQAELLARSRQLRATAGM
jgi:hypothetical protein